MNSPEGSTPGVRAVQAERARRRGGDGVAATSKLVTVGGVAAAQVRTRSRAARLGDKGAAARGRSRRYVAPLQ